MLITDAIAAPRTSRRGKPACPKMRIVEEDVAAVHRDRNDHVDLDAGDAVRQSAERPHRDHAEETAETDAHVRDSFPHDGGVGGELREDPRGKKIAGKRDRDSEGESEREGVEGDLRVLLESLLAEAPRRDRLRADAQGAECEHRDMDEERAEPHRGELSDPEPSDHGGVHDLDHRVGEHPDHDREGKPQYLFIHPVVAIRFDKIGFGLPKLRI